MKKLTLYSLLVTFICSFLFSSTTIASSTNALTLWFKTLVPSFLFPLILVRLLSPYHLLQPFLRPFDRFFRVVFHINANAMECIISSLFLGFPSSSLYLEDYAKKNHFTKKQYGRLLNSVFICSPNFILLSLSILYPSHMTHTLLLVQLICVFTLLLITRNTPLIMKQPVQKVSFFTQLKSSIHSSFETLLMILAFLMMTYVFIDIATLFLPVYIKTPLKLLSEFSSGCFYLSTLPIAYHTQLLLTTMVLSYGGLCVHMQLISMLNPSYFSYAHFMKYRIFHITLSCLLIYLLW